MEHFNALQAEFPEAWHLAVLAEDRCRGEAFARIRRELDRKKNVNLFNVDFDEAVPWSAVFQIAARDEAYWDKEVRRPAVAFLTRGASGAMPTVSAHASAAVAGILGKSGAGPGGAGAGKGGRVPGQPGPPGVPSPPGEGRRGRKGQRQRQQWEQQEWNPKGKGKTGKKGKKGNKPPYHYTRENLEICYKFAKGGRGACSEVCPAGRAHVCQYCLQPHPNSECGGGKGQHK